MAIALSVPHAAAPRVPAPRAHAAEGAKPGVLRVPVGVVLDHQGRHLAVVVREGRVVDRQQRRRVDVVAVAKRVVLQHVDARVLVVARAEADERTPVRVQGKEMFPLARLVGCPIGQRLAQTALKQRGLLLETKLVGHFHVLGEQQDLLAAPVRLGAVAGLVGVAVDEGLHHFGPVGVRMVGGDGRRGWSRQQPTEGIANFSTCARPRTAAAHTG